MGPRTPAQQAAEAVEDELRHNATETGVLIARDGSEIRRVAGEGDRVAFTHGQLILVAGATLTHNHPNGTGFSVDDIELGIEYGLDEVRVVTKRYRYGASQFAGVPRDAITPAFTGAVMQLWPVVTEAMHLRHIDPDDFHADLIHRAWGIVSHRFGFTYWRA